MSMITHSKLILVEGKDEVEFFGDLLSKNGYTSFQILSHNGKSNFKNILQLVVNDQNFDTVSSLAIIRDADNDFNAAFDSIIYHLKNNNIPIPSSPNTTITKNNMTVGVFVMPSIGSVGMLESLVLTSVIGNPVLSLSDQYIQELSASESLKPNNIYKAKLHAYLSGMKEYVPSIGMAVKKNYFDLNNSCFDDIKEFIQSL